MRRAVAALAAALAFYAYGDVLLWQRIFEANRAWTFDAAYQTGHREVLLGLIAVGTILLLDAGWWALWYGAALFTLAMSGLEDVLYYWLDGRAIPAVLPWLDASPFVLFEPVSSWTLIASAVVWVAFWSGTTFVVRYAPRLREPNRSVTIVK